MKKSKKTNPMTLKAFIAWLKKKPARGRYSYGDPCNCLAAQYHKDVGREYTVAMTPSGDDEPPSSFDFDVVMERIALDGTYTFGSALKRTQHVAAEDNWKY